MPARAFLLFGRGGARRPRNPPPARFNAREGIFAFRTHDAALPFARVLQGFNAREGIFAFRTEQFCLLDL